MCFLPLAMFIQRRQIHSSAGCAVVLPPACNVNSEAIDPQLCGVCRCASSLNYYHAVAPRHWLAVGDSFDDPEGLISLEVG